MKVSEIKNTIRSLGPWFHNIHLAEGIQTAPDHFLGDFPRFKWKKIEPHIPVDLSGKKVLDIGCNAGFYSFELAKRGAEVTAIDLDSHYLKQAEWATGVLGLERQITFKKMQVYDLAHFGKKFDITWFMGVFYHLRYPLLALDIVSEITREMMIFQTLMMPDKEYLPVKENYNLNARKDMLKAGWPKMGFIEKRLNDDPTNWWAPNRSAVEAMARTCGFTSKVNPDDEIFIMEKDLALPIPSQDWNRSEYLSAIGKEYNEHLSKKVEWVE